MNESLTRLYENRFSEAFLEKKNLLWKIVCGRFLQQFVSAEKGVILGVGAGFCHFINNIRGAGKHALDLNPENSRYASADVRFHAGASTDLSGLPQNSFDCVFTSNLLEHLSGKEAVLKTFREFYGVLKPSGTVLLLGPNIKYAYREYWDYFDHQVPLSEKSVCEGLRLAGFEITQVIPRFLPFSTQSVPTVNPFFLEIYLRVPWLRVLFGKQFFIAAKKNA